MERSGRRAAWAAACLTLVSLPFLAVDFVPSTDLPQHLGQLRLFGEAWADPAGPLSIQWWTPYGLVYGLLALPWAVLPPVVAGRVGVWLLVLLQVAAVHWIAARWQRPVSGAVLASLFVFNMQLYWGFLNFLFGFVLFVAWFGLTRREGGAGGRQGLRTAVLFLGVGSLLYLAHALWFAVGLLWLALEALISRRAWSDLRWRLAGVAPVVLAAFYWFAFLRASSFVAPPEWDVLPHARFSLREIVLAGLGGLRHDFEIVVVVGCLLWILAALVAGRKERWWGCEPHLLALALLLLGLYLVLPTSYATTIRFSMRWLPFFFLAILLAVGRPRLRQGLRRSAALVLLATYMVVTTAVWRAFEARELSGLAESLEAVEGTPRVLGLSYMPRSRYLYGQPFLQVPAWTHPVHGGALAFSFADLPPSLVVYKDPERRVWTPGLEWFPKAVRRSDFLYFDYALIGGDEAAHRTMGELDLLQPVVTEGLWRLYRVAPVMGEGAPPAS